MAIAEIIKYEGTNDTFVWKHPAEDFNTNSQLIVHETQEAILFLNGQALDLFGSGRYTLHTQNIPLLRHVVNLPTHGESPFHCEVYFVNKAEQMAIRWGTDSKVQYVEPTYGFPLSIGARGEMSLKAVDTKQLLVKLVGTEKELSQERIVSYFRAFLMTKIKSYIAQTIKSQSINIFEIDEHLMDFSDELKERLSADFLDYGVSLERFFVTTIVKPDGEPLYEQFKSLHYKKYADVAEAQLRQQVGIIDQQTEAQKIVIESQAMAQKRSIEGYSYEKERMFDVAEKAAANEGSGSFSSMGIGLGMMTGLGSSVGTMVNGAIQQTMAQSGTQKETYCENCGTMLCGEAAFCDNCGAERAIKQQCVCGFVFERAGNFCPKCGRKRETVQ
ncbi:MAG: SPFH domain-containing protein [Oscillospiraceae bacterium]|nr:SPFH domain-containing protein [Oscillospiraceae bacterium]